MESSGLVRNVIAAIALLVVAVVSCGCPATNGPAPSGKSQAAQAKAPEAAELVKATEKAGRGRKQAGRRRKQTGRRRLRGCAAKPRSPRTLARRWWTMWPT